MVIAGHNVVVDVDVDVVVCIVAVVDDFTVKESIKHVRIIRLC